MTDETTVPTHAGGVVVRRSDSHTWYLLVSARRAPDQLVLPKGHIEPDETMEAAACREVLEEAGVVATILDRLGTIDYGTGRTRIRSQFFLMEFVSEGPPGEGRRRAWLSLDEALAVMPFADTRQLMRDADQVLARRSC